MNCIQRLLIYVLTLIPLYASAAQPTSLKIFAAASLTNALQDIGKLYTQHSGTPVVFSFAASSTLARQIEAGANVDVFLAADEEWMDYLGQHNLIDATTRTNLLGNSLVMIAPIDSDVTITIQGGFKLSSILKNDRLAIADPDTVPAGKYARSALQSLNLWNDVENKLVKADSVRSALMYVALKESPLGLVYVTDALLEKRVRVVYRFSETTHPPIVYPVATTSTASPTAKDFIQFLQSSEAQDVFVKYGFKVYGSNANTTGQSPRKKSPMTGRN